MATLSKVIPCLWFDTQAEQAAQYYTCLSASIGMPQRRMSEQRSVG